MDVGVLTDYFWDGLQKSKEAFNTVVAKTSETLQQSGVNEAYKNSVQPGLQTVTQSVTSTSSSLYNEGFNAPVIQQTQQSAAQIAAATAAATKSAYDSVDQLTGGNVSASL